MSKQGQKYLHLEAESFTEVTRERDPDDEWSGEDTSSSWNVTGITLSERDGRYALPADFPVEVGDTVWAVYVVYSTGDSFSHSDAGSLELVSFHKDKGKALKNADVIRLRDRSMEGWDRGCDDGKWAIEFDSGEVVKLVFEAWDGYFERLCYVEVAGFAVAGERVRF